MKCLAQTQGAKIRVNAVLPGLVLTEWVGTKLVIDRIEMIAESLEQGNKFSPEKIQQYVDKTVLKHTVRGCRIQRGLI